MVCREGVVGIGVVDRGGEMVIGVVGRKGVMDESIKVW